MFWSLVVGAGIITAIAVAVQHFGRSRPAQGTHSITPPGVTVGRATSDTMLRAPLTGRECVYWTVMVCKPDDQSFAISESRTSIVGVEAASGERIRFTGDKVRYALSVSAAQTQTLPRQDLPPAMQEIVQRHGGGDAVFEVIETSIAPGSTIYVTGSKTAAGPLQVEAIFDAPPQQSDVRTPMR